MYVQALQIATVGFLDTFRGEGIIKSALLNRISFAALAGACIGYEEGATVLENVLWCSATALGTYVAYWKRWGKYLGSIFDPTVDARNGGGDAIVDAIMSPLRSYGRVTYGVHAMGVRMYLYSLPLLILYGTPFGAILMLSGLPYLAAKTLLPGYSVSTWWRLGEWGRGILFASTFCLFESQRFYRADLPAAWKSICTAFASWI